MTELERFNFVKTLVLEFKKNVMMKQNSTFYSTSRAATVINENDKDVVFESICSTVITNIPKSKYKPLNGSSYIKLPKK